MSSEHTTRNILVRLNGMKNHFPIHRGLFQRHVGDVKAVDGVSFDVGHKETLSLVGESGCGKTTAGRTLLRLLEPTGGRASYRATPDAQPVELFDLSRHQMRELREDLQIIFQDPYSSLNPRKTAGNIVGEALRVHGIAKGQELEDRVAQLLVRVGLRADAFNRFPHEFSGGQRQRICVARALAVDPRFVVCDESVSALDVSIQAQILNLLRDLQENLGLTYLFITHDLGVVRYLADRVAVMYVGQIVEEGTTEQIFEAPAHPYTRALLAAIPSLDPERRRVEARALGDVPSPANPPPGCRFHTRCSEAFERCSVEEPGTVHFEGRSVRCFLAERAANQR